MSSEDDRDLEGKLRGERREAPEEFVHGLAADVRARRRAAPRSRPRLTLAFALSLALLVSLVAFGGVGAASNALRTSATSLRMAVAQQPAVSKGKHVTPAANQYSARVPICVPVYHWAVKYRWITRYRWTWKTEMKNGREVKLRVRLPVPVKFAYKVKERTYAEKLVSAKRVARLVSRGAIYPVPEGGCPLKTGG